MRVLAMKIRLHENFTSEIFYQQKYPDLWYVYFPCMDALVYVYYNYVHAKLCNIYMNAFITQTSPNV